MVEGRILFPGALQKRILHTLSDAEEPICGLLMGRWVDETLMVISAYHCSSTEADEIKHSIKEAGAQFPGGIGICGMYYSYPSNTGEDAIMRYVRQNCASLKDHIEATNLLICVHQKALTQTFEENAFWYHVDARETSRAGNFVEDSETQTSLWQNLVMFRLKTTCQIIVPYDQDPVKVKHSLGVELGLLIDSISSSNTAYHVQNSPVLLHNQADEQVEAVERKFSGVVAQQPCSEIFQLFDRGEELQTRRKIKDYGQEIVNVSVLRCATPQNQEEKSAFYIYVDEVPTRYLTAKLTIDCLVMAESSEPIGNLPALFTETLTDQLTAMGKCMCQFYHDKKLPRSRPVHIKPVGMDHLVTVYYPDGFSEDELDGMMCPFPANYRRYLQTCFHLPLDRPLLRISSQYLFPDQRSNLVYLQNTHVGLPKSGVSSGVASCVEGVYSYHHYMQDSINDNGWGCAYRSLQTIVSWFRHQGYTQEPVPTHAQIQQALVDVGDKEAPFVGSRQWIGSTEVGFCLDHLLGIQSRFLVVNAGRDLADKGRELAQHFQQQGTPIMIGGGVLAHTILGVDFNEQTGEVKFLILDPHYTGPEDIKEIQSKGWCGWKGPDFWDQTAFYNLCMPQRPKLI